MKICILFLFLRTVILVNAQHPYFVDGYHGGIYGHYPVEWKTQFIVDQLAAHPDWRICLEIEPETWDTVQVRTPEAYRHFGAIAASDRVEFTNPTYAQPYCYNISGESIIRQFQYGIRKIHAHFPDVKFVTYSVEEPCFTSCLPQLLHQLGFKYAVLKCPNTCWGGYTTAHGGELVNWIGPDGTSLLSVPRYACEMLEPGSTWQTTAWANSNEYLSACREAGILHPVGMCFQDAGWKNGPWLGSGERTKNQSIYTLWRDYVERVSVGKTNDDWRFSQEDVLPCLMWGSQVLQRIAQQVRTAENNLVMAEKLSVMARVENDYRYREADMDEAWRTLMLAQHHDSWIVPYNGLHKQGTWADAIRRWTGSTNTITDKIREEALQNLAAGENQAVKNGWKSCYLQIANTLGAEREEVVGLFLPDETPQGVEVYDWNNRKVDSYLAKENGSLKLFFKAKVPAFGYSVYHAHAPHVLVVEGQGVVQKAGILFQFLGFLVVLHKGDIPQQVQQIEVAHVLRQGAVLYVRGFLGGKVLYLRNFRLGGKVFQRLSFRLPFAFRFYYPFEHGFVRHIGVGAFHKIFHFGLLVCLSVLYDKYTFCNRTFFVLFAGLKIFRRRGIMISFQKPFGALLRLSKGGLCYGTKSRSRLSCRGKSQAAHQAIAVCHSGAVCLRIRHRRAYRKQMDKPRGKKPRHLAAAGRFFRCGRPVPSSIEGTFCL